MLSTRPEGSQDSELGGVQDCKTFDHSKKATLRLQFMLRPICPTCSMTLLLGLTISQLGLPSLLQCLLVFAAYRIRSKKVASSVMAWAGRKIQETGTCADQNTSMTRWTYHNGPNSKTKSKQMYSSQQRAGSQQSQNEGTLGGTAIYAHNFLQTK